MECQRPVPFGKKVDQVLFERRPYAQNPPLPKDCSHRKPASHEESNESHLTTTSPSGGYARVSGDDDDDDDTMSTNSTFANTLCDSYKETVGCEGREIGSEDTNGGRNIDDPSNICDIIAAVGPFRKIRQHRELAAGGFIVEVALQRLPRDAPSLIAFQDEFGEIAVAMEMRCNQRSAGIIREMITANSMLMATPRDNASSSTKLCPDVKQDCSVKQLDSGVGLLDTRGERRSLTRRTMDGGSVNDSCRKRPRGDQLNP